MTQAIKVDLCAPERRGTAMGIYRFWRDLGYFIGALVLGLISVSADGFNTLLISTALLLLISSLVVFLRHPKTVYQ